MFDVGRFSQSPRGSKLLIQWVETYASFGCCLSIVLFM